MERSLFALIYSTLQKKFGLGGYDRGECLKTVEEYDVVRGEWKQLHPMKDERGRFDSAVLNGLVYAIAGSNGNNDLKTAEVYNPKTNQWSTIPSLSKPRSHNGCATLDNFIFCVGGSCGQEVLKECERFDVSRQVKCRITFLSIYINSYYMIELIERWNCMDSVEAYDPKTNSWRMLSKMRTARRGCAVAVIRGELYNKHRLDCMSPVRHPHLLLFNIKFSSTGEARSFNGGRDFSITFSSPLEFCSSCKNLHA
ncbi:unnamed protein product [Strongylus vulgaris]|uniref:Kelch repeat protein n=1 Tax=Strongylus vulgaris TaxID=40348 RepID=A0A3P7JKT5_STRVU|nr:unnamed protein product [Strongylus vulgaris]